MSTARSSTARTSSSPRSARAFSAHGLEPPSRERALSIVGLSLVGGVPVLVGPDGPVESLVQAYRDAFNGLSADPANDEPLYPGADGLPRRPCLDATMCVSGIATGKSRRGVRHLLDRHGWHDRVRHRSRRRTTRPSKPHPAMIEQAMAQVGVAAGGHPDGGRFHVRHGDGAGGRRLPDRRVWGFQPVAALEKAGPSVIVAIPTRSFSSLLDGLLRTLEFGGATQPI